MVRLAMQSATRTGAMALLTAFIASTNTTMQLYRAKPKQAKPPTGYVEGIEETLTPFTIDNQQRTTRARIRLLWRDDVDAGAAVDQRDAFIDGFAEWVIEHPHAFDANALTEAVSVSDDPDFDFGDGTDYLSSLLVLEGFAAT